MDKASKQRAAYKLLKEHAPSIDAGEALACADDEDLLIAYVDQTWETISPKGLAVAAAQNWLAIIEGELCDLEGEAE